MFNYYSLYSSSSANVYLIETEHTKVIIDIGVSFFKLKNTLKEINLNLDDIDAFIITHEHIDHTRGIKGLENSLVYMHPEVHRVISEKYQLNNVELIVDDFQIDDLQFNILNLSHDAAHHLGFIIKHKDQEIVHITDTGYLSEYNLEKLKNKNLYAIESNYEPENLMLSERPFFLKKRIISDSGHLSNEDCFNYLQKITGSNTKKIHLLHLSKELNDAKIVLKYYENSPYEVTVAHENKICKIEV